MQKTDFTLAKRQAFVRLAFIPGIQTLLYVWCFLGPTGLYAQFPSSFENWEPSGQSAPLDWEEPAEWASNNPLLEFGDTSVYKTLDSHTGIYAAALETTFVFDSYYPAQLSLGQHSYQYQNQLLTFQSGGFSKPNIPQYIQGWYKYQADEPDERGVLQVDIYRGTTNPTLVYTNQKEISAVGDYTSFQLAIDFPDYNPDTDQIVPSFFSNRPGDAHSKALLLIDDVEIDFTTSIASSSTEPFFIFPNPVRAGKEIIGHLPDGFTPQTIEIRNATGQSIQQVILSPSQTTFRISTKGWAPGVYGVYFPKEGISRKLLVQ